MEFAGALEDGSEAAELAVKVSNQRAELLGLMLAGLVCLQIGQFEEADAYVRRSIELAQAIGASNFAAQAFRILAQNSARERTTGRGA